MNGIENQKHLDFGEVFISTCLAWTSENNIKAGQLMMALRIAMVGGLHGIDLKKIVSFVGPNEVYTRLEKLQNYIH